MKNRRKAFALSIVLWIVAALLLGIAFLSSISRHTIDLTGELDDKLATRLRAQSVVEALKFYIMTARFDHISLSEDLNASGIRFPPRIVLDGRKYRVGDVEFSLHDLSSKINVFHPAPEFSAGVLASSRERTLRYTIRDSILDWIDRDNFVHLNGAELSYYRLILHRPYRPRNNIGIQSVDEFRLIRGILGIDEAEWKERRTKFYAEDKGHIYNLALLDEKMLAKLLNLNFLEAAALRRYRQEDMPKFITYLSGLKNFDDSFMGFSLSFAIEIDVSVQRGSARSRVRTMVDFHGWKRRIITYDYAIY